MKEAMDDSLPLPLHLCHVRKSITIINRVYTLIHSAALISLVYYRVSFLFQNLPETRPHTPTFPWLLLFFGELILSFIWLLGRAYRWTYVTRTSFPERLPDDKHLPAIDVFICTADPKREPTIGVMNTVISAMALDYPPEKLHVYVSDDGGSSVTLYGMKEAWAFARLWLPFCRAHGIKTRCPDVYFSGAEDDEDCELRGAEFLEERQKIKIEFELFAERVKRASENCGIGDKSMSGDHSPTIEMIGEEEVETEMPILVYVSREKRPSHPHHFKAGAINVLVRVSSLISNSPYILLLDCDMHCNDPSSARQAMCYHLDPKLSPSLAFVQFPQKFHNISSNDIYDSQIRSAFSTCWEGMDGVDGPVLSGTNLYMKRIALYGTPMQDDNTSLTELRQTFGYSDGFIKSLIQKYKPNTSNGPDSLGVILQETRLLATCQFENQTKWGEEVGALYHSVCEDVLTGYSLHCKGWKSVLCHPTRPQFLGSSVTNLNDVMVQSTRTASGLVDIGISKFCPFIYGPLKASFLQNICYAELSFFPFYFLPMWCFASIPQLCLFNGIPLYPEVSSSFFYVFAVIFVSALVKHLSEVISTGGSIQTCINEQRIWMIKSVTCLLYGSLDAIMKRLGIRKASFLPTNKVADGDHVKLYQIGKFDFRISNTVLTSMVTVVVLNMAAFIAGIGRVIVVGDWKKLLMQVLLSLHILIMSYPLIEGMIVRKDMGRIPYSVTLVSIVLAMVFLTLGSVLLY